MRNLIIERLKFLILDGQQDKTFHYNWREARIVEEIFPAGVRYPINICVYDLNRLSDSRLLRLLEVTIHQLYKQG